MAFMALVFTTVDSNLHNFSRNPHPAHPLRDAKNQSSASPDPAGIPRVPLLLRSIPRVVHNEILSFPPGRVAATRSVTAVAIHGIGDQVIITFWPTHF